MKTVAGTGAIKKGFVQLKRARFLLQGHRFPVTGPSVPLTGPRFPLRGALLNCLIVGHSPGFDLHMDPRGASKNIGLGWTTGIFRISITIDKNCPQDFARKVGQNNTKQSALIDSLSAPYRAIPRDYLSDTPLACALWGFSVSTWPIGCDTPSPFSERFPLGEHAKWRCDTPPTKGYLSDTCAIPYDYKENACDDPPSAILSRKVLRDTMGGYLALGR